MTTALEDAPLVTDNGSDDEEDLDHWFCECSPEIGLCGTDLTGTSIESFETASCMVCEDVREAACLRCGVAL